VAITIETGAVTAEEEVEKGVVPYHKRRLDPFLPFPIRHALAGALIRAQEFSGWPPGSPVKALSLPMVKDSSCNRSPDAPP
jgi:hypothetical protein